MCIIRKTPVESIEFGFDISTETISIIFYFAINCNRNGRSVKLINLSHRRMILGSNANSFPSYNSLIIIIDSKILQITHLPLEN